MKPQTAAGSNRRVNQLVAVNILQDIIERNVKPEVADDIRSRGAFVEECVSLLLYLPDRISHRRIPEPVDFSPSERLPAGDRQVEIKRNGKLQLHKKG